MTKTYEIPFLVCQENRGEEVEFYRWEATQQQPD